MVRTSAGGTGLIPGQRTKIPCVRHHSQNGKKKKMLKIIFLFSGLDFCLRKPCTYPTPITETLNVSCFKRCEEWTGEKEKPLIISLKQELK